ncbi:MAG: nodulation protein NodH, partial [Pseudomonadota bacterium]
MTVRYFVIIGTMRSGSNFLEKQIAASDDVVTYGEAFNPAFTGGPKRPDLAGWTVSDRDADPLGFLAALLDDAAPATMGFRLFNGHSDRLLAHVVDDPDCGVIVLRRDAAESFVSLRIAEATGQWLLKTAR